MAYGSLLSLLIELLQLALMKGAAEVDDVIHNTTGCVIGYGLVCYIAHKNAESTDGVGLKASEKN